MNVKYSFPAKNIANIIFIDIYAISCEIKSSFPIISSNFANVSMSSSFSTTTLLVLSNDYFISFSSFVSFSFYNVKMLNDNVNENSVCVD